MQRGRDGGNGDFTVSLKTAALGFVLALGTTQGMAQPVYDDDGPISGLPLQRITGAVRAAGLMPITAPRRVGPNYIVRSVDRDGVLKRVVVDAHFGEIVRIRTVDAPVRHWRAFGAYDRPPRPPVAFDRDVAVIGPDADLPDADPRLYREPPPRSMRAPAGEAAAPAPRRSTEALASAPAAAPGVQGRPPHEPDTESLPQASGAPAKRPVRSATVMPAKPPLPVRRPAAPAEPAAAKPDEAAKAAPPAPPASPRVVLPGGPAPSGKGETTASTGAAKPADPAPAEAKPAAGEDKPAAKPSTEIVPAQSYE